MQIVYLIGLIFILLIVIFAAQNPISIPLKFLFWEFSAPFLITLLSVTVVSVAVVVFLGLVRQRHLRLEIRRLRSLVRELEEKFKTEIARSQEQPPSQPS